MGQHGKTKKHRRKQRVREPVSNPCEFDETTWWEMVHDYVWEVPPEAAAPDCSSAAAPLCMQLQGHLLAPASELEMAELLAPASEPAAREAGEMVANELEEAELEEPVYRGTFSDGSWWREPAVSEPAADSEATQLNDETAANPAEEEEASEMAANEEASEMAANEVSELTDQEAAYFVAEQDVVGGPSHWERSYASSLHEQTANSPPAVTHNRYVPRLETEAARRQPSNNNGAANKQFPWQHGGE